jgi:hypothetical protein
MLFTSHQTTCCSTIKPSVQLVLPTVQFTAEHAKTWTWRRKCVLNAREHDAGAVAKNGHPHSLSRVIWNHYG